MTIDRNPLLRDGEEGWPTPDSARRRWLRQTFNRLVLRLAQAHTPGTIVGLGALAGAANFTHLHGPTTREVCALYDWLPPGRRGGIARDIAALHLKNLAAIALVEHDLLDRLAALVRWPPGWSSDDGFKSRSGQVLMAAHVGAFFGIRAALHRAGRPALMLRDSPLVEPAARARALKQAIDCLRDGGLVVATIDGPGGTSTSEVDCLGRRIVLRRGPFALARLTGAPLVPVVCAWTAGGNIEVRIAPAIEPPRDEECAGPAFEAAMAAETARWLERYLRTEPQEIWLSTLRHYLAAPKIRVES